MSDLKWALDELDKAKRTIEGLRDDWDKDLLKHTVMLRAERAEAVAENVTLKSQLAGVVGCLTTDPDTLNPGDYFIPFDFCAGWQALYNLVRDIVSTDYQCPGCVDKDANIQWFVDEISQALVDGESAREWTKKEMQWLVDAATHMAKSLAAKDNLLDEVGGEATRIRLTLGSCLDVKIDDAVIHVDKLDSILAKRVKP